MIENLATPRDKIIIEVDRHQIEMMAALTHLFLIAFPENVTANSLIKELNVQTPYVSLDPKEHGIMSKIKTTPYTTSQQEWGSAVSNLDFSNLGTLLLPD